LKGEIYSIDLKRKEKVKERKKKFTHSKEKLNRKGKLNCSPSSHVWR
jgi:hypothetical protein